MKTLIKFTFLVSVLVMCNLSNNFAQRQIPNTPTENTPVATEVEASDDKPNEEMPDIVVNNATDDCYNMYRGNIKQFRNCMCDIQSIATTLNYCRTIVGGGLISLNSDSEFNSTIEESLKKEDGLLPSATYTYGDLLIDTKVDDVTDVRIQIFDLYTSKLKYSYDSNVSSKDGQNLHYENTFLSDGIYIIRIEIDGFVSSDKLVVVR